MHTAFDPYREWLEITAAERPPTHYAILGVDDRETDAELISAAADRRMAFVKSFALGSHSAESQQILNEIAAAKICLCNPSKRAAYEATLTPAPNAEPIQRVNTPPTEPIDFIEVVPPTYRPEPLEPDFIIPLPVRSAVRQSSGSLAIVGYISSAAVGIFLGYLFLHAIEKPAPTIARKNVAPATIAKQEPIARPPEIIERKSLQRPVRRPQLRATITTKESQKDTPVEQPAPPQLSSVNVDDVDFFNATKNRVDDLKKQFTAPPPIAEESPGDAIMVSPLVIDLDNEVSRTSIDIEAVPPSDQLTITLARLDKFPIPVSPVEILTATPGHAITLAVDDHPDWLVRVYLRPQAASVNVEASVFIKLSGGTIRLSRQSLTKELKRLNSTLARMNAEIPQRQRQANELQALLRSLQRQSLPTQPTLRLIAIGERDAAIENASNKLGSNQRASERLKDSVPKLKEEIADLTPVSDFAHSMHEIAAIHFRISQGDRVIIATKANR